MQHDQIRFQEQIERNAFADDNDTSKAPEPRLRVNRATLSMRITMRTAGVVLLYIFSAIHFAQGQPVLEFKRVINLWPTIESYFSATCNGQFLVLNDTANISLKEDEFSVKNYMLDCPDPNVRAPISVSLAVGFRSASSSVVNTVKDAAKAFIDSLDGVNDEAAVIAFSDRAEITQSMTNDRTLLKSAIDGLTANSTSYALSDGIYTSLIETINYGSNQYRAVIVFSLAWNNVGIIFPGDIIGLALRNHVRIFVIDLGSVDNEGSKVITLSTGGKYYLVPNYNDVASTYQEILGIIRRGFDECSATYQTTCMDGSRRTVELGVKDVCGGSTQRTKTYRSPTDTSTWRTIDVRLQSAVARPPDTIVVPLELHSSLAVGEFFFPGTASFTLDTMGFNPSDALTFLDAVAPLGTLLSQAGLSYQFSQNTLTINTSTALSIQGTGTLCYLRFLPKPLDTNTQVSLRMSKWTFTKGCLRILPAQTDITVIPPIPDLACRIHATSALALDYVNLDYAPNPLPVKVTVINNGQYPVKNVTARIMFDTTYFAFVLGSEVEQKVYPELMQPGNQAETTWYLHVKRQRKDDTTGVRVELIFMGNTEAECEKKIFVPSAAKRLGCTVTMSVLGIDSTSGKYTPNPIIVTSVITNIGIEAVSDPAANILLPPEAAFTGPNPQTGVIRPLSKKILQAQERDTIQWAIGIGVQSPPKTIRFVVEPYSLLDTIVNSCFVFIDLPRSIPVLEVATRKQHVTIDSVRGGYTPIPFTLGALVSNKGIEPAENATVTLNLSPGLQLAPGETATKSLASSLSPRKADSVFWQVLAAPASVQRVLPFSVHTRSDRSIETIAQDSVLLPPMFPVFDATCTAPAKLVRTGPSGTFAPNPFTVEIRCRNVGSYEARNVSATVTLHQDVELVTPTEPLTKTFTPSTMGIHQLGDPIPMLSWQVRYTGNPQADTPLRFPFIVNATNPLDTVTLSHGPLVCATMAPGDTVTVRFACDLDAPDRLTSNGKILSPNPAVVSYSVVNLAGYARTLERVRLDIPQSDIDSVDAGTPPARTPNVVMQHGDTARFTWLVTFSGRLNARSVPMTATAHFDFGDSIMCTKSVVIEPLAANVLCTLASSAGSIRYRTDSLRYDPQTFLVRTEVENTGGVRLTNVRAMLEWTDPSGLSMIEFDPGYPDNSNPKRSDALEAGSKETFDWGLRMTPNVFAQDTVRVCFTLRHWSDQTPVVANACRTCVTIEPKITVGVMSESRPESVMLHQNHPNPTDHETTISFTLKQREIVRLEILDLYGRKVSVLSDGAFEAGSYRVRADTRMLKNGVYAYVLHTGSRIQSRMMIVSR